MKVTHENELYAIRVAYPFQEGSEWFGNPTDPLQAQSMAYLSGKSFRVHKHILNPRIINRTQEAFIVITGRLDIDIYTATGTLLATLSAGPGEAILIYRGAHGVRVIEDFTGYEIKAGQFSYVSEDKEFMGQGL